MNLKGDRGAPVARHGVGAVVGTSENCTGVALHVRALGEASRTEVDVGALLALVPRAL